MSLGVACGGPDLTVPQPGLAQPSIPTPTPVDLTRFAYMITDAGLGVYKLLDDGMPALVKMVDAPTRSRWNGMALESQGRFLLAVDGGLQDVVSFVVTDGLLTEVDRKKVPDVKDPTSISISGDSVFVEVDDTSTGEGHNLHHMTLSATGTLTLSNVPPAPTCAFAQSSGNGGDVVFRRDGRAQIVLQQSKDGIATVASGAEVTRSSQTVVYLGTARYPGLRGEARQVTAIGHPTRPWLFWSNWNGIGTFSIDVPGSASLLEMTSEASTTYQPRSLVVDPSGRWLYASTSAGIESLEIREDGSLRSDRALSASHGYLTMAPNGSGIYEWATRRGDTLRFFRIVRGGELQRADWVIDRPGVRGLLIGGAVAGCGTPGR